MQQFVSFKAKLYHTSHRFSGASGAPVLQVNAF
jgi:hypothetical protein